MGAKWTDEEIAFARAKNTVMTIEEMALRLGRTVKAVRTKCVDLGLRAPSWRLRGNAGRRRMKRMCLVPLEPLPDVPEEWLVGMIQTAPGHAYDPKSHELRMRAYRR